MKKLLLLSSIVAGVTAGAYAQNAPSYWVYQPNYVVTGGFQSIANGGTADQAGNLITRMVMDDVNAIPGYSAQNVYQIQFMTVNPGTAAVSVRPRLRFWNADGTGAGLTGVLNPGTYYVSPTAIGYTFNPITFTANQATLLTGTLGAGFLVPSSTMWAGITYDNNIGATGATLADMDAIGTGLAQPSIGTSTDTMFQTTAPGSFFTTANPAGAQFQFTLNDPLANMVFAMGVQGQYYRLEVNLNDTVGTLAWDRNIGYTVTSGTTTVKSGVLNFAASSSPNVITADPSLDSPFVAPIPNRDIVLPAIGPGGSTAMTLTLDGGPYLKRVINFTLPTPNPTTLSPAISLPVISMQNGDVDGSGEVDAADIDQVIADFGGTTDTNTDVDASGEVDAADIDIVIANFGGVDE